MKQAAFLEDITSLTKGLYSASDVRCNVVQVSNSPIRIKVWFQFYSSVYALGIPLGHRLTYAAIFMNIE